PKLQWTDAAALSAKLDVAPGGNVFRLDTAPLEAAIRTLPAVSDAHVSVTLPDAALIVRVDERVPVLAWQVGAQRFIADSSGAIFGVIDADAKLPAGVAVVDDERPGAGDQLWIGAHLDEVDLDVATRLGSI